MHKTQPRGMYDCRVPCREDLRPEPRLRTQQLRLRSRDRIMALHGRLQRRHMQDCNDYPSGMPRPEPRGMQNNRLRVRSYMRPE